MRFLPSIQLALLAGRGRSLSALWSPSFTNRLRTRPTVARLISSALATSWSGRPSSAFNNTSARLTLRADDFPRRATSLHCDRSDSLNSTFVLDGRHVFVCPPYQIIRKTNLFLILCTNIPGTCTSFLYLRCRWGGHCRPMGTNAEAILAKCSNRHNPAKASQELGKQGMVAGAYIHPCG